MERNEETVSAAYIKVSIPYEREGAWKGLQQSHHKSTRNKFQFPTNGKGHGKSDTPGWCHHWSDCFNSLRTGRGMERLEFHQRIDNDNASRVSIPYEREGAWKAVAML